MTHAAAGHYTSMGLDNRKMAFWTFIGSECLLFGSLISTYLVYKGRSVVGPYPHEILNIPFTSVSTFDLLMSSLTMSTNLFGCTFFVLTGTHGAHVAVGVLWLLTLWVRALQGKLGPANAMTVEITGLYWHFVDVVWIVIFTVVYLIQ